MVRLASGKTEDPAQGTVEWISGAILQGVRSGMFAPGQHLAEVDLTARLGISRGSLREALKHLAVEGVVTLSRFKGAAIAMLDEKAALDLLDVMEPLARLAAQLAASACVTAMDRARITDAADAIVQAAHARSRTCYFERRRAFYDVMVSIGGNAELARYMPLSRIDLFRAQAETLREETQASPHSAGYGRMARAISDNDMVAAERATALHFEEARGMVGRQWLAG